MHRLSRKDPDAPGHDSFLDIVANMVGILIILVMVVGMRAKNAPVVAAIPHRVARAETKLKKQLAAEQSLRQDVLKVADQIQDLQQETNAQGRRRAALATMVSALKHQIRSHTEQMDAETQEDFDRRRSLSEAKSRRDQLGRARARAEAVRAEPIVVQSYPTPLSKTVDQHEVHFQLRKGRVAFVPWKQLLERALVDARLKASKLFDPGEIKGEVGPEGGFRIHYKYNMTRNSQFVELIPVSRQLGESIEDALAEGSRFRRTLANYDPDRSTVTIWTYPDSFAEFRRLKKEAFRLGFATAARPLPSSLHIRGSHHGSKSAAQ